MISLCAVCHKNAAVQDSYYGFLPCQSCMDRQASLNHPNKVPEMPGEDIQEQRRAYATDIRPAHRKGVLDRGFIDRYGKDAARRHKFTEEEIEKATYVYDGDDTYYKNGN